MKKILLLSSKLSKFSFVIYVFFYFVIVSLFAPTIFADPTSGASGGRGTSTANCNTGGRGAFNSTGATNGGSCGGFAGGAAGQPGENGKNGATVVANNGDTVQGHGGGGGGGGRGINGGPGGRGGEGGGLLACPDSKINGDSDETSRGGGGGGGHGGHAVNGGAGGLGGDGGNAGSRIQVGGGGGSAPQGCTPDQKGGEIDITQTVPGPFPGQGGWGGNSCGGFGQPNSGQTGGAGGPACAAPTAVCGPVDSNGHFQVTWNWGASASSPGNPSTTTARLQVFDHTGARIHNGIHASSYTTSFQGTTFSGQVGYHETGLFSQRFTKTCGSGDITDLNFALIGAGSTPWFQTLGLDVRFDTGYENLIPSLKYASAVSASSDTPGIIFTGDKTADFGESGGRSSVRNWIVGGNPTTGYPETYNPTGSRSTTYNYLYSKSTKNQITPIDLSTKCTLSNCSLPANLPNGVYHAEGPVNLNAYTFPVGKNYVFLIDGNLTIKENIEVEVGSTALFSSSQDIIIDTNVGIAAGPLPSAGQVQGLYSADNNFIVQGINNCALGPDKMLNFDGVVIANADSTGGTFKNLRDLCAGNSSFPSVTFNPRLDFILNAPTFLRNRNTSSREEAP